VDLGYTAPVGSVALQAGPNVTQGATIRMFVQQSLAEPLSDANACSPDTLPVLPGSWAVTACNVTGR